MFIFTLKSKEEILKPNWKFRRSHSRWEKYREADAAGCACIPDESFMVELCKYVLVVRLKISRKPYKKSKQTGIAHINGGIS